MSDKQEQPTIPTVNELISDIFSKRVEHEILDYERGIYNKSKLTKDNIKVMRVTTEGYTVIDGAFLFTNMDAKGLPLEVQLQQLDLLTCSKFAVDWTLFIDRARSVGWWSFQAHDRIQQAIRDSDLYSADIQQEIIKRVKLHICKVDPAFQHLLPRAGE